MTTTTEPIAASGIEVWIPLNKLKKSPSNARHTPHGEAAIEALAASIHAKGMLQNLIVQPECDRAGKETGAYFVTAGEGRRLAQLLRAKRRQIPKTEPIRCIVDTTNDPLEVSLDENVTRTEMHPADQFEAFRRLSEERGWGAEEIASRFGVTPNTVRQRMRLAAVSPRLMQLYREEELTLDQLMAFAIGDDHARQEQIYDSLGWNDEPRTIRYRMMETHVPPRDPRAIFVGMAAYTEAGGTVVRDLFTEEDGGYFEDATLLDRLALEKLNSVVAELRGEGWKWAEVSLEFPYDHGLRRVYPQAVKLPALTQKRLDGFRAEYARLVEEYEGDDEMPDEMVGRLEELEAEIERLSESERVYLAGTMAGAGVFVSLGRDGAPRIERGFVRREDEPVSQGETSFDAKIEDDGAEGERASADVELDRDEGGSGKPLSDALVRDLTAHRTLGLRLALSERPEVALIAVTHALAAQGFFHYYDEVTCLEIRSSSSSLGAYAGGINDTAAAQAFVERHEAWASQLPSEEAQLWDFISALDIDRRMGLLAHCAALTVFAVQQRWDTKRRAVGTANRLAEALGLDMAAHWAPTVTAYLGRVTKAQIADAVREGVSEQDAEGISSKKKQLMAEAAEQLLANTGWLPSPLRTPKVSNADTASHPDAA
ncbi:MAG: ParB/RepB/Spo0J family partition protein [Dehalococcoidia bacterium]|nr:MAG: ParB/RepB/Spo0J family partition protein [Dehalococcoidia bacterium]